MRHSQNNEQDILESYFGQYVGTLLSIGENDGQHLSNVYALIQKGWGAELIEPSPQVFEQLWKLHNGNKKVWFHDVAIGDKNDFVTLYESGELLKMGDKSLVSTVIPEEMERWRPADVTFSAVRVLMVTFDKFFEKSHYKKYDLISIDAEGMDLTILRQMDLDSLGCKCLCIEWNSLPNILYQIMQYCSPLGFKEIGKNGENIILAR
jgi:FkbM family methyltransferase